MSGRVDRRLGWVTANEQRFPEGSKEAHDARQAIEQGICPYCGEGPFTVVAIHASKKHGIDRFEIRALAGFKSRESICDETHSAVVSERTRRTSVKGWKGDGHLRQAHAAHISDIEARTAEMAEMYRSGRTIVEIAASYDLSENIVRRWLHDLGYVVDARLKGSPAVQRRSVPRGPQPHLWRSHCAAGHEMTPENTYWTTAGNRSCRTCQRARDRKRLSGSVRQRLAREAAG